VHRFLFKNCIAHVSLALALLAAFTSASAQIALEATRPFHRFTDEAHAPSEPPLVAVGWDNWVTLEPRSAFAANEVRVPVAADNTFRLGDALDLSKLSADALGVIVAVDSVWGRNHHYVTTAGVPDAANFRFTSLPPELAREKQRRLRSANLWLREVPKLPREYRSQEIALPENGARLSFAVGFEDILEQAGVREFGDPIKKEGRQTPAVRARVLVSSGATETEVFSRDLRDTIAGETYRRFQRFTVNLSDFAGKKVRVVFRFEQAAKESVPASFALPVWGNPVLHAAAPVSPKKNLLLISLDTLRADHLGLYGYSRDTSPHLDAFAAEATIFEDCLSTSSWTSPAHGSVFTGLSPILHGAGGPAGFRLRESVRTLAELARANGYLTAAFTQGHAIGGKLGFAQGFDQYSNGPESGALPQVDGLAEQVFAQATRWLDEFGQNPFVLFMHTYEIHAPYLPPDAFHGKFTNEPRGDGNPAKNMSGADRDRIVALYDEGIAYTDHALGNFFAHLRATGILDRTHVIIFSDHGEEFWEHGGISHSFTLYQEQLHVPLIVRIAGDDAPRGRIGQRVILSDLFATSLDLLGITHTPSRDSISLVPLMQGAAYPRSLFRAELYKENMKYFMIAGIEGGTKYTARTQYDQPNSPLNPYILAPVPLAEGELALLGALVDAPAPHPAVEEMAFNLTDDPGEGTPLIIQDSAASLRRALLDDLRLSAEEARLSDTAPTAPAILTDAEREQLRALGYVE